MSLAQVEAASWNFTEPEWKAALYYLDRNQMALLVRDRMGSRLPAAVRTRLDRDYGIHRERLLRIRRVYAAVERVLAAQGIEWTLLKGFGGAAEYYADP